MAGTRALFISMSCLIHVLNYDNIGAAGAAAAVFIIRMYRRAPRACPQGRNRFGRRIRILRYIN